MSWTAFEQLLRLRLAVSRARLSHALSRRSGPAGPVIEGLVTLGAMLLLLASAAAFTLVGTVLLATLARRGELELTAQAAGGAALAGMVLACAAAVANEAHGTRLDDRPLAVLPIRSGDRLAAELVGLILFEPAAAVIWPAAAIPVLAAGQHGPRSALLAVPAAAGQAVLAAALALLARNLARATHRATPALLLLAGGALLPMLIANEAGPALQPWTPWGWNGLAFVAAWRGSPSALAWGVLAHLAAFGVLALVRVVLERPRRRPALGLRLRAGGRVSGMGWPVRIGSRRCWGQPRARELLWQSLAGAGAVLAVGLALGSRWGGFLPTVPLAGALAAWILAASPAPLLANTFGLGGPAGISRLLASERPARVLAADHLRIGLPCLVGLALCGTVLLWAGGLRDASLPLSMGAAMLMALSGTGAATSCVWPWPAALSASGDPLWGRTGPRAAMALAQGIVVTPWAAAAWHGAATDPAVSAAGLALGAALGGAGWLVAAAHLRGSRGRIVEGLLP